MHHNKYSRVELSPVEPIEESGTIALASVRSCCGCGAILNAMGGGGLYICHPCKGILTMRLLSKEFAAIQESAPLQGE